MKYFLRILAFLFISFSFGYSRDCGDPSKIDDSLKKGCSVGYRIVNYNISDDRSYKFSDDYFYESSGKLYFIIHKTYYMLSSFDDSMEVSGGDLSCTFCAYDGYRQIPKQYCPAGQYAKMETNGDGKYTGQTCTSECFELHKRRDRFDCTCNKFGLGNYVSSSSDSILEISKIPLTSSSSVSLAIIIFLTSSLASLLTPSFSSKLLLKPHIALRGVLIS